MKTQLKLVLVLVLMGLGLAAEAQPVVTQALAMTGVRAEGNCFCNPAEGIFGKKKKRRKGNQLLAAGAVIGGPVGFGGRVVFTALLAFSALALLRPAWPGRRFDLAAIFAGI